MILIIAEKPELGKAIANAIDGEKKYNKLSIEVGEYKIVWAIGHILRHKKPEEINENLKRWKIEDLPIFFDKWDKIVIEGKETILDNIGKELKKASYVIHAGDPDDEGQYLIDEILDYFNYKGSVKRLLINDNNTNSIKKAFLKIENNEKYRPLGHSAEARSISDMLIGFNLTRFYTLKNNFNKPLTVGRVQTPTLALVLKRDLEIKNHVKQKYFNLYSEIYLNDQKLKLKYTTNEEVVNKETLENLINEIKGKKGVLTITKKRVKEPTPLPFNLAELQIEANKKFGYRTKETLEITQYLREKHKAITYNRSDCSYLTEEHFKEAPIQAVNVSEILKLKNIYLDFSVENKSRAFNDNNITAHHGIIPTENKIKLSELDPQEKNIYELIAKRYLIQFMLPKVVDKYTIEYKYDNYLFKGSKTVLVDKGYLSIYSESDPKDDEDKILDNFPLDEQTINIEVDNFVIEENETKPKKPYTEATLLKDMTSISKYVKDEKIKKLLLEKDKEKKGENGSIGTPATRSDIIADLFRKSFLKSEGKYIVSTDLAREYLKILPDSLKNPDMTALWYNYQENIKNGTEKKESLINYVLYSVIKILESDTQTIEYNVEKKEKEIIGNCPVCGKNIYENKKGYYCSDFKNCKTTLWKEIKYFDQKIKINKSNAKKLLANEEIEVELLNSKKEKYKAKFKIKLNNGYVNLEKVKK